MTCSLRVKLTRLGILDPQETVLHCAELGSVTFPVPVVTRELDKRSTGARKRQRHNFQSKKERNDYYNGLKKLREALGEAAMV